MLGFFYTIFPNTLTEKVNEARFAILYMLHVTDFRYRVSKIFDHYQSFLNQFNQQEHPHTYLTVLSGVMNAETAIRWCDTALALLEK